ncbi:hypothetical protein RJ639_018782 [Escallonia herrerae]|uniref:Bifunctional inhibitor/plant lipid transfer protein/seed storage helical domain-containing protein n=1 Tax=Escallonia herrerae TaxID=1293975 RepID=A0AA88V961_9ASTE|nr:hypothetical protein RJ639_018782 [Escallonia herrerae]
MRERKTVDGLLKMKKVLGAAALCVVLVLLLGEVHVTKAVNCVATELTPCAGAIMWSQPPSPACCGKLREQLPCLCQYLNNPALRPYVDSPNAQKVARVCNVPTPKC